jgi:hypothetical protein
MTVPDTYRIIKGVDALSEEEYKKSSVLGWCTELVSSLVTKASVLANGYFSYKLCS